MFPSNSTEFSKGNYLITSNESIRKMEDRLLNRENQENYRYEKMIDYEINLNKHKLSTLPLISFRAGGIEPVTDKIHNLSTLNYDYDDNNYKRRNLSNSDSLNNNNNNISPENRYTYNQNNIRPNIHSNFEDSSTNHYNSNFQPYINKPYNAGESEMKNYNNDLSYYRSMIDKMQNEIGSLNSKLNEIEKNNNSKGILFLNSSNSQTNYLSPRTNFRPIIGRECNSNNTNKPNNPEKEYLLKSNYEFDKHINAGSKNFNSIQHLDNNVKKNTPDSYQKNEIDQSVKKINKTDSKNRTIFKSNSQKNIDTKELFKKNRIQSVNKNNSSLNPKKRRNNTPSSKKYSATNSHIQQQKLRTKTNNKVSINTKSTILDENEDMKRKISNLEESLKKIKEQINIDNYEKRVKHPMRIELEIWKNKSETIAKSYLHSISNIKKQLIQDKTNFLDQVNTMQTNFIEQIKELKKKNQSKLDIYELNFKKLKKENEQLKLKMSRVKEILTPKSLDNF